MAGLTYHVWARGSARMPIYLDDADRRCFLKHLDETVASHHLTCHAFCQMTNHYHLVITTNEANLSRAMHQLNSRYAEWWSRRHDRPGHVFQGRFGAQIISTETYLLTACVYIARNPTRAGVVATPGEWPWSSYRPTAGLATVPPFLQPEPTWRCLSDRDDKAALLYRELVEADQSRERPLQRAPVLGDDAFVGRFKEHRIFAGRENPKHDRASRPPLERVFARAFTRDERRAAAVSARAAGYSASEVAAFLGVHRTAVSHMTRSGLETREVAAAG